MSKKNGVKLLLYVAHLCQNGEHFIRPFRCDHDPSREEVLKAMNIVLGDPEFNWIDVERFDEDSIVTLPPLTSK